MLSSYWPWGSSWQKLSLHKLKKLAIYNKHPQVIQLNTLKNDVKKIAEKYNFKFIDTDNYFLQLKDPLSVFHYGLNTHFNSLGNQLPKQTGFFIDIFG